MAPVMILLLALLSLARVSLRGAQASADRPRPVRAPKHVIGAAAPTSTRRAA